MVPDIITKLIEAGKTLFSYLTWGRIAMMMVMTLFFGVSLAFWENRPHIYSSIQAGKFEDGALTSISEPSVATMKRFTDKDDNIVAMQVLSTDFRKFVKDTIFFYSDAKELEQEFELFHTNKDNPSPVLAVGDEVNNARLIAIINQEFICVPLPAGFLKNVPSSVKYAEQVCSISVPPQYGKMVGYINIWMKKPVAREDLSYYQTLARTVADEIYERDAKHRR